MKEIKDIKDLKAYLLETINEVRNDELNLKKANTIYNGANTYLKALRTEAVINSSK